MMLFPFGNFQIKATISEKSYTSRNRFIGCYIYLLGRGTEEAESGAPKKVGLQ